MKKIFFISLLLYGFAGQAQQTKQDCTDESVKNEPGRFLDAHIGGATGGSKSGYTTADIANSKKMMTAFENICKPKLQFTGGQAKASFILNSKPFYNQQLSSSYTYSMGFHQFVCNVQTHKLAIVDEYQGVLRITGNPGFQSTFNFLNRNDPAYRIPANTQDIKAPFISVYEYYAFSDSRIVNAINNGNGFIDLTDEVAGAQSNQVVENKPGKGYGWNGSSGFVKMQTSFIFRHAFITHIDIPFFIPVSRKKFLTDLLEFYNREKPLLVANMQDQIKTLSNTISESEKSNSPYLQNQKDKLALMEKSAQEIATVNDQKKQTAANLLKSKDEKWLNQQVAVELDNKSFTIPYDRNRNMEDVYGKFYFTDFYTGAEGLYLYQINPEYLKKYPLNGTKPALIDVMYRYRPGDKFLAGVNESFINQLNLDEFRKLME